MSQSYSRDEILTVLEPMLREYCGKSAVITEATPLYEDGLWIGGDDAGESLDEVRTRFGTRFQGFDFANFFPGENEDLGIRFVRLLERVFRFRTGRRKPLTVGHLV